MSAAGARCAGPGVETALVTAKDPKDVVVFRRARRPRETTSYVGMMVFLGGWAMMFGGLFFAYALVRLKAPSWPPPGELVLPRLLPAINTAFLVGVSLSLRAALSAVQTARPQRLLRCTIVALLLGALFFSLQLAMWRRMWNGGLHADSGVYGSVFYALTSFHALHVIVGLVGLVSLLPRIVRGAFSVHDHTAVRMWSMYWHFVDAVWVLMFITVYVV
jgi:cytochrome c oxidase subunit 3